MYVRSTTSHVHSFPHAGFACFPHERRDGSHANAIWTGPARPVQPGARHRLRLRECLRGSSRFGRRQHSHAYLHGASATGSFEYALFHLRGRTARELAYIEHTPSTTCLAAVPALAIPDAMRVYRYRSVSN